MAKTGVDRNVLHSLQNYKVEECSCSIFLDFVQSSSKNVIIKVFWENTLSQ